LFEPIGKTPIERAREGEKLPKYIRNTGKEWTEEDVQNLETLAEENTPTRVIGLQLGRSEASVRSKADQEDISLKPTNQSPYGNNE
jgi:hypothetical protein